MAKRATEKSNSNLPTISKPRIRQKAITKSTLDDARTVVSSRGLPDSLSHNDDTALPQVESISSYAQQADSEDSDVEEEEEPRKANRDVTMTGITTTEEGEGEEEDIDLEPTFGDLVRTTHDPIDVVSHFPSTPKDAAPNNLVSAPLGASLGTVLTQALKTNDSTLLESCLHTTDLPTIRTTIQRLPSSLAATLLSTLAKRLHRSPGRAGSLISWIQWTLVSHGGYLATQTQLVKQLTALNQVIDERARGLPGLLMLKGKLDMLESQGALRAAMIGRGRAAESADDEEDDGVVYVEGQADSSDEGEEDASKRQRMMGGDVDEGDDSEEDDEMPTTSMAVDDEDDDEEDEDDDSIDGFIDDEAEETEDSMDEDLVDHDDEDDRESGDESDEAHGRSVPTTKMQNRGGLFSKVKR